MALTKKGQFNYGDTQADIQAELVDYSATTTGYEPTHFAEAVCRCGERVFTLSIDDTEGAAVRQCRSCQRSHAMGDSAEYLEDANLKECECPCGAGAFELTVGVALYRNTDDVRWIYIGARCPKCGLTACYADWKNEFSDYRKLLEKI
ncbi:MAG: hypothetical protein NTV51_14465 [Verrucomicrobia bacterium]|nr:hypothetical protein [Verrucomicrobiota bacterium]